MKLPQLMSRLSQLQSERGVAPFHLCLGVVVFSLINPSCTGTEGDNPLSDPVDLTVCKGHEDYQPLSTLYRPSSQEGSPFHKKMQPFVVNEDVPVWLECVQWELVDSHLNFQLHNFSGGCAVDWQGDSFVDENGRVVVALRNDECVVARCGSCIYDMRSSGGLEISESKGMLELELSLENCEGEVTNTSTWQLPLHQESEGLICREADSWGASSAASSNESVPSTLYQPCGEDAGKDEALVECQDELHCASNHCVPECSDDDDCPLSGALECRKGYCHLPR